MLDLLEASVKRIVIQVEQLAEYLQKQGKEEFPNILLRWKTKSFIEGYYYSFFSFNLIVKIVFIFAFVIFIYFITIIYYLVVPRYGIHMMKLGSEEQLFGLWHEHLCTVVH